MPYMKSLPVTKTCHESLSAIERYGGDASDVALDSEVMRQGYERLQSVQCTGVQIITLTKDVSI